MDSHNDDLHGESGYLRPEPQQDDTDLTSIRPAGFDEFVGQADAVANLKVMLEAARLRGESLEHVLFSGPPGLGKTTLARIIANEMGANLVMSSGPVLDIPGDLVGILTKLRKGDVLFIDEIHRLKRNVEEVLYPAMEDYRAEWVAGSGPGGANLISLKLEKFTLVGATTRSGLIGAPLRDRFGALVHLEFYDNHELAQIITRAAGALEFSIDDDAALHLAAHSRGTPRIAIRLLKRMRDFATVAGTEQISSTVVTEGLSSLSISEHGLDRMDREILLSIIERFEGGPVGLDTLAAVFHEERDVLAEVHEPYLLKMGYLQKTPRGRVATGRAYEYFGKAAPKERDIPGLFDGQGDSEDE